MDETKIIERLEKNQQKIGELEQKLNQLTEKFLEQSKLVEEMQSENKNSKKLLKNINELFKSVKPIKSIYSQIMLGPWVRIYHTDENWLNEHNNRVKTKYTGEIIGYAFTKNPEELMKG